MAIEDTSDESAAEQPMKKVLILCTGNSCRSQMAEGLWNHYGRGKWQAFSAGSRPSHYVHHLAVQAMDNLGIDISSAQSKSATQFANDRFDVVVTVCDNARGACPVFPGAAESVHWPFDNPAEATGTDTEKMQFFERIRDQIATQIKAYLKNN